MKLPITVVLTVLAIALRPMAAAGQAGPFNIITAPSSWGSAGEVPITFSTSAGEMGPTRPGDAGGNYSRNVRQSRYFIANASVQQISFYPGPFNTEYPYDYLFIGYDNTYPPNIYSAGVVLTGAPAAGPYTLQPHTSLQANPIQAFFNSDWVGTSTGFSVPRIQVRTLGTTPTGVATMREYHRYQGVLLGDSDTVRLSFPRRANLEYSLVLTRAAAGVDFDIYVRCNAQPTQTAWDYGTPYVGNDEHIIMPASYCPTGTVYVAVNSWSGRGEFSLNLLPRQPSQVYDLAVGSSPGTYGISTAEFASYRAALAVAARRIFGQTEGTQRIVNIRFYQYPTWGWDSCGTEWCWGLAVGSKDRCNYNPAPWSGKVYLFSRDWSASGTPPAGSGCGMNSSTIAHEWGHQHYFDLFAGWLVDEYDNDPYRDRCGHSIMATLSEPNICTTFDHGHDPNTMTTPPATSMGGDAGWRFIWNRGMAPNEMIDTPDRFTYENFDYAGVLGNVIQM